MEILSPSELGKDFEAIGNELYSYFNPYTEKDIRQKYPTITTIDILIFCGTYCFIIQCKFKKNKAELNEVKAFVSDCKKLIELIDNKNIIYYPIYLTRVENTKNGKEILLEINGQNIYLYDDSNDFEIKEYTRRANIKDYKTLLMRLYNYIVKKTGTTHQLKEIGSDDILMSYDC